jgi:hypothetical protein
MSLQETQPVKSHRLSLRSILLSVLFVTVGAGAAAYFLGNAFAAINDTLLLVRINSAKRP